MIYTLALVTVKGRAVYGCPKCVRPGTVTMGAQNKDDLAYMLFCEGCETVLGEWVSLEERDREIGDLAQKHFG